MSHLIHGIISYPHVFQPKKYNANSEPRYSANFFVLATDPVVQELMNTQNALIQNKWPSGAPANLRLFVEPCTTAKMDKNGTPYPAEYHSYVVIKTSAKVEQKPNIVDMDRNAVIDPSTIFGGAMVYANVNPFVYDDGVSCGLNGIMVTGEVGALGRFDGRPIDQMFSNVGQQTAAPPPVPQVHTMTAKAGGVSYEAFIAKGWNDEMLIAQGYMQPPNGVMPSFA